MAQPPKDLSDISRRSFDLYLSCRSCKRRVVVPISTVTAIFEAGAWSKAWPDVKHRFRCSACNGRKVTVGLIPYGARESEDRVPSPLTDNPPPPRGVPPRLWYDAMTDGERRRLIRLARG